MLRSRAPALSLLLGLFLLPGVLHVSAQEKSAPAGHLEQAQRARAAGDLAGARRLLEQELAENPKNGRAALVLGEVMLDQGEVEPAEKLLRRLVEALPERPEARRVHALALLRLGRPEDALDEVRQAIARDPSDPESHRVLGAALASTGRWADAVAAFERTLKNRPSDVLALHGLARAYAALEDPEAERIYERLVAAAPNAALRLDFVEYLWEIRKFPRGNAEMERVLRDFPGQPKLRAHYGMKLHDQADYAGAVRELGRAWRDGAKEYEVLYFWGSALWGGGHFDEAADKFERAIVLEPDRVPARHWLGQLRLLQSRPREALAELSRAAAEEPGSAPLQLDLGRAHAALREDAKAEASFREALRLDPELFRAHYMLGTLLARTGRREEAQREIALYQEGFRKDQERRHDEVSRRAELNLAWTLLRQERPAEALERFRSVPDDPEALHGQARCLARLGRSDEAIAAYERALALSPGDPRVAYELDRERARLAKK